MASILESRKNGAFKAARVRAFDARACFSVGQLLADLERRTGLAVASPYELEANARAEYTRELEGESGVTVLSPLDF